jgi:hypothetical protein
MSTLTATYTAPDSASPHTITLPLPAVSSDSPSTDARVAHLANLQSSIKTLQAQLNAFLTERMDEDKVAAGRVDDANEEANYGEEVVEE